MNLAPFIELEHEPYVEGLNPLQAQLYMYAVEAANAGRSLIIPTDIFPRACGKSYALGKAAQDITNALLLNYRGLLRIDEEGNDELIARRSAALDGSAVRGLRVERQRPFLIIDDCVSYIHLRESSLSLCNYIAIVHDMDTDAQDRLRNDERIQTLRNIVRSMY